MQLGVPVLAPCRAEQRHSEHDLQYAEDRGLAAERSRRRRGPDCKAHAADDRLGGKEADCERDPVQPAPSAQKHRQRGDEDDRAEGRDQRVEQDLERQRHWRVRTGSRQLTCSGLGLSVR